MHYKLGTMIEVPRGALQAGNLAKHAEFFSFGTNDLTQMTFGISRDDAQVSQRRVCGGRGGWVGTLLASRPMLPSWVLPCSMTAGLPFHCPWRL